jgi:diguanylate cyclase (GGDEF)-like protein
MNKTPEFLKFDSNEINRLKSLIPNAEELIGNIVASGYCDDDKYFLGRIDIASFKMINDKHGYEIGDRIIYQVFKTIEKSLTGFKGTQVARVGGDEYIFGTSADKEAFKKICETIIIEIGNLGKEDLGIEEKINVYISLIQINQFTISGIREKMDELIIGLDNARKIGKNIITYI